MQDEIVEPPGSHEPTEHAKTPKKAAASGWIGSALEYYDFFIYAQAASLVFPLIFFPSTNPQVAIVASFATFGVGYAARPIGAFVLGLLGRQARPQERARAVHVADRGVDLPRRAAPDLRPGRDLRADPAGGAAPGPGLRGRRGDRRRQRHDHRALAVRTARVLRQLHPAGRAGRAGLRRRDLPAAGRPDAGRRVPVVGLADPVPAERRRRHRGLHHPAPGRRDPGVPGGGRARRGAAVAHRRWRSATAAETWRASRAWP